MTNIIHLGLGPLGRKIVRHAVMKGFNIVGAVDPAPEIAGKDVGELCDLPPLNIAVAPDITDALNGHNAQVALVTTVSSLERLESQVTELARAGLHVVSTCEELVFPWNTQPETASRIDAVFKQHNVTCLGTGVNPGFLMDFLPTVMTAVCREVNAVRVWRIQDASVRRIPFQQKIGAGLTVAQFREKEGTGTLRHVGLPESIDFIAHQLGWQLSTRTETLEPVIAQCDINSGYTPITEGMACGVEQIGRGYLGDDEVITLHFRAAVGEPESYDRIEIDGMPPISSTIAGGVNGDIATCAITINAVRSVLRSATPGLKTMLDIPAVGYGGFTE